MPRDYKVYLDDMREAIVKIEEYTKNFTYETFARNSMVIDAVIRNLAIIGEAAKNLPIETQKKYPSIEWKKVAGLRDILIHAYFGVNQKIIWDILQHKIPELKQILSTSTSHASDKN